MKPNKFRRAATTVNPSQMTSVYFVHDNEQEREQIAVVHMKDISNTLLEAAYVVWLPTDFDLTVVRSDFDSTVVQQHSTEVIKVTVT